MRRNDLVIPADLPFLQSHENPGLVSGSALCWITDDLVYSEYGYPGTGCGATSQPFWYGPAAEFARQLAPLCVWPCTFVAGDLVTRAEGSWCHIEQVVRCPENAWLAPYVGKLYTPGNGQGWAARNVAREAHLTGGVIEALAFFARTGQAALPRWIGDDHSGRDRWIDGKKHKHFYSRIQDLEAQHE